jgi:hypothetical protein
MKKIKIIPEIEVTKEMKEIQNAIAKYVKKHDGKVAFVGSFVAFKGKDLDVVDDMIFCFGSKDVINISLDEIKKEIKKEKDDFICW